MLSAKAPVQSAPAKNNVGSDGSLFGPHLLALLEGLVGLVSSGGHLLALQLAQLAVRVPQARHHARGRQGAPGPARPFAVRLLLPLTWGKR